MIHYAWMYSTDYPDPPELDQIINQDYYKQVDEWHNRLIEFWERRNIPITEEMLKYFNIDEDVAKKMIRKEKLKKIQKIII